MTNNNSSSTLAPSTSASARQPNRPVAMMRITGFCSAAATSTSRTKRLSGGQDLPFHRVAAWQTDSPQRNRCSGKSRWLFPRSPKVKSLAARQPTLGALRQSSRRCGWGQGRALMAELHDLTRSQHEHDSCFSPACVRAIVNPHGEGGTCGIWSSSNPQAQSGRTPRSQPGPGARPASGGLALRSGHRDGRRWHLPPTISGGFARSRPGPAVGAGVNRSRPANASPCRFKCRAERARAVANGTMPPANPARRGPGGVQGFGESGGGHGGGVADLCWFPDADHLLVPAPVSISDVALAITTDNLIDAYRTVVDGLADGPAEVLVVGGDAPSISLYVILCARALGAGRIRYADNDSQRLSVASDLGAETIDLGDEFPGD